MAAASDDDHRLIAPGAVAGRPNDRAAQHVLCAVAALVGIALVATQRAGTVLIPPLGSAAVHAAALDTGIDPNRAGAAELTVLPGIGATKARRIVAFREAHRDPDDPAAPVFFRPEDLERVHGIGPRTVEVLRPMLRFDQPPVSDRQP